MTIIPTNKARGQDHLIAVCVTRQGNENMTLFIDKTHVLTLRFKSAVCFSLTKENVIPMEKARKKQGLYISKHVCPEEILHILTGSEMHDMGILEHALKCFQKIYSSNGQSYSFSIQSYNAMLKRFFINPVISQRVGKGDDLAHYFMDLPVDYEADSIHNDTIE
tara:strand:- start:9084 stop:9575 length:492 start_codon:yes stop_codon:yes gene_type:complete